MWQRAPEFNNLCDCVKTSLPSSALYTPPAYSGWLLEATTSWNSQSAVHPSLFTQFSLGFYRAWVYLFSFLPSSILVHSHMKVLQPFSPISPIPVLLYSWIYSVKKNLDKNCQFPRAKPRVFWLVASLKRSSAFVPCLNSYWWAERGQEKVYPEPDMAGFCSIMLTLQLHCLEWKQVQLN